MSTDPRHRFRGTCLVPETIVHDEPTLDVGALLERLLLFDVCVLESARLYEVSQLVRLFGPTSVAALLRSGALRIRLDGIAQGWRARDVSRQAYGRPETVWAQDPHAILSRAVRRLDNDLRTTVDARGRGELLALTQAAWIAPDPQPAREALRLALADFSSRGPFFLAALMRILHKLGKTVDVDALDYEATFDASGALQVRSNLSELAACDHRDSFAAISAALGTTINLNTSIARMQEDSALTVLRDDEADLDLFRARLEAPLRPHGESLREEHITRVLTFADVPDLGAAALAGQLELEQFLDLRASQTAAAFREWVRTSADRADAEVRENLSPVREALGRAVRGVPGKALRVVAAYGIGEVVAPGFGLVASALDMFVTDKLLPRPGPLAFLKRDLPGVIDSSGLQATRRSR